MNLSILISKDGLATHMTATYATTATQKTIRVERVASVATVAVATSAMSLIYKQRLIQFVHRCCAGCPVTAQQVIDYLLSVDDEQDIINGMVPAESLRLHIVVWISTGKVHYSGKKPD